MLLWFFELQLPGLLHAGGAGSQPCTAWPLPFGPLLQAAICIGPTSSPMMEQVEPCPADHEEVIVPPCRALTQMDAAGNVSLALLKTA